MQVVVKQKVHLQLFDEAVLRLLVVSFCRLFMLPARGDTVQMCVHYLSRTSVVDVHADDALQWQRRCCCWDTLQADREAEGFIPSAHSVMCVLFLACVTTATLQRAEQEPCSWRIIRLLPDVFFTQQHEIFKLLTPHKLWKQYELLFISAFWLRVMICYFSLKAAVVGFTCVSGSLALHHPAGVGFSTPFPPLIFWTKLREICSWSPPDTQSSVQLFQRFINRMNRLLATYRNVSIPI